jgi:hypothetical protein
VQQVCPGGLTRALLVPALLLLLLLLLHLACVASCYHCRWVRVQQMALLLPLLVVLLAGLL